MIHKFHTNPTSTEPDCLQIRIQKTDNLKNSINQNTHP